MPTPRFKNGLCRMPNGVNHTKFKLKKVEILPST